MKNCYYWRGIFFAKDIDPKVLSEASAEFPKDGVYYAYSPLIGLKKAVVKGNLIRFIKDVD